MTANPLGQLLDHGQSFWMDTISREMIQDGTLARMIAEDGLRGVTSNPDIFNKAISGSDLYDNQIERLAKDHKSVNEIYEALVVEDIQKAADVLRSVWDGSKGVDGLISLEVSPYLAFDTAGTISEARHLWKSVDRPNVFIKVPATPEGIVAIRQLTADGININVTLIFSIDAYNDVMDAYISGVEERIAAGKPVDGLTSVASFFISRIDVLVDKLLGNRMMLADSEKTAKARTAAGNIAIASAKLAYQEFGQKFGSDQWQKLEKAGARMQRPLWASTSTKNPMFDELVYVTSLIDDQSVNTMPMNTIEGWRQRGVFPGTTISDAKSFYLEQLTALAEVGIDLDAVTWQLLEEGVSKFNQPFDKLLGSISTKRLKAVGFPASGQTESLGKLQKHVDAVLEAMSEGRFGPRLYSKDASLFQTVPPLKDTVDHRLGWVGLHEKMLVEIPAILKVVDKAKSDQMKTVVLLGMGGSSLCPEVCSKVFGTATGFLELHVLDSTSPDTIQRIQNQIDLKSTLFIVASKSGGTIETATLCDYFQHAYAEASVTDPGKHFIAITDPDTELSAKAERDNFRHIFINPADIGGRYSALSLFGLVPMALIGVDISKVLDRVRLFAQDGPFLYAASADVSVRLGGVLGALALTGRDKMTLVASDNLSPLGSWIEQLVAESTGKRGVGIVPVDLEPLTETANYGNDRVFVSIRTENDTENAGLDAIEKAGHPVVRIVVGQLEDLGAEFYRWEIATAMAGKVLSINPFDEPNVAEAKANTKRILDDFEKTKSLPVLTSQDNGAARLGFSKAWDATDVKTADLTSLLSAMQEVADKNSYLSILLFADAETQVVTALDGVRNRLRSKGTHAVTIGIGPRYLHSTGQLHKGGSNTGVFLVIVAEPTAEADIPGKPFSFGTLIQAQGIGDFQTLGIHNRRAALLTVPQSQLEATLKQLN